MSSVCWLCCPVDEPLDPPSSSLDSSNVNRHAPEECHLLREPLALAQQLQRLTQRLLAQLAVHFQPSRDNPTDSISRNPVVHDLAMRKARLECLLHGADAQLSFHGSVVTGFLVDPGKLADSLRELESLVQEERWASRTSMSFDAMSTPAAPAIRRQSTMHANVAQVQVQQSDFTSPTSSVLLMRNSYAQNMSHLSTLNQEAVARSQNDAVLMSLLSPGSGSFQAGDGTVAHRTRAKLPLHDTSIDDLEKLLVDLDEGDDGYSDVDYSNFVRSLAYDGLHNELETDREDDDELVLNEQESIREPDEEYRNDPDVEVTMEELKELLDAANEDDDSISEGNQENHAISRGDTPVPEDVNWQSILEQTKRQLNINFQLCVQNFAISRDLVGLTDETTQFWLAQLLELNSLYSPGSSVSGLTIDGIHLLADLFPELEKTTPSPEFQEAMRVDGYIRPGKRQPISLPASVKLVLKLFENYFDPSYVPVIIPTVRRNFTEIEDELLLRGLRSFGNGGWKLISKFMLPGKTVKQLQIRFKNRVARRAGSNPIKEFDFICKRPMTSKEQRLLEKGVSLYGTNFYRISSRLIPGRPPGLLAKAWNLMKTQNFDVDGSCPIYFTSSMNSSVLQPNSGSANNAGKRRDSLSLTAEKDDMNKRTRLLLIPEENEDPDDSSVNDSFQFADCPTPDFFMTFY